MATPSQILANLANAQLSTGPKTETGKAASAANSTKHGLSSAFAVLPHEDQSEFDGLLTKLETEHQPATEHQAFLVAQLAKTQWLLARAQRLQNKAFEHLAGLEADPEDLDARIVAQMFKTNPNALTSLQRYATQAESSYYKAWRELKTSKQIQNEANCVASLAAPSTARIIDRIMEAPLPDHPACGPEPAATQYGYIPQTGAAVQQIRAAAAPY